MESKFLRTLRPESRIVFRQKLKPFTLGHFILLRAVNSPLSIGGKIQSVQIHDVILAAMICSKTYRESLNMLQKGFTAFRFFWLGFLCRKNRIGNEIDTFLEYLKDWMTLPRYLIDTETKNNPKTTGAPLWQSIRSLLMTEMGYTDAELMDRPFIACYSDYLTIAESKGAIKQILSQEQEERINGVQA